MEIQYATITKGALQTMIGTIEETTGKESKIHLIDSTAGLFNFKEGEFRIPTYEEAFNIFIIGSEAISQEVDDKGIYTVFKRKYGNYSLFIGFKGEMRILDSFGNIIGEK